MLGIDITRISRFENPSNSFVKKILHSDECVEYENSTNKPRFLAKRWAIKEALFKADNSLATFNAIRLGKSGRILKYDAFEISTSSEGDYYIAVAIKGR